MRWTSTAFFREEAVKRKLQLQLSLVVVTVTVVIFAGRSARLAGNFFTDNRAPDCQLQGIRGGNWSGDGDNCDFA